MDEEGREKQTVTRRNPGTGKTNPHHTWLCKPEGPNSVGSDNQAGFHTWHFSNQSAQPWESQEDKWRLGPEHLPFKGQSNKQPSGGKPRSSGLKHDGGIREGDLWTNPRVCAGGEC